MDKIRSSSLLYPRPMMWKKRFLLFYVSLDDGPYTLLQNDNFLHWYLQFFDSYFSSVTPITPVLMLPWCPIGWPQNAILWMSFRITLHINRKLSSFARSLCHSWATCWMGFTTVHRDALSVITSRVGLRWYYWKLTIYCWQAAKILAKRLKRLRF